MAFRTSRSIGTLIGLICQICDIVVYWWEVSEPGLSINISLVYRNHILHYKEWWWITHWFLSMFIHLWSHIVRHVERTDFHETQQWRQAVGESKVSSRTHPLQHILFHCHTLFQVLFELEKKSSLVTRALSTKSYTRDTDIHALGWCLVHETACQYHSCKIWQREHEEPNLITIAINTQTYNAHVYPPCLGSGRLCLFT